MNSTACHGDRDQDHKGCLEFALDAVHRLYDFDAACEEWRDRQSNSDLPTVIAACGWSALERGDCSPAQDTKFRGTGRCVRGLTRDHISGA
jgi:hypothetical protein